MSRQWNAQPAGSILVGIDGSAPSRAAIRWAVHRGALEGVEIVLIHVDDDSSTTLPRPFTDPPSRSAHPELLATEFDIARLVDRRASVTVDEVGGDPLDQLVAASTRGRMLVLGTHKTGFVQWRVFGSRFIQLAGLASCPVAFIPNSASKRRRGIVVGVRSAEADDAAIRFAAQEADRSGQDLVIICGRKVRPPGANRDSAAPGWEADARAAEVIARQECPSLSVRSRLVDRPPAEALVDASMRAVLLVIGRSRRIIDQRGLLGSTVHDVLLNLTGPTIVVP
ncbi:MAG: universal stress protein [Mycetocola sp.]